MSIKTLLFALLALLVVANASFMPLRSLGEAKRGDAPLACTNNPCQSTETCCTTTQGPGCCPAANACCCPDKQHCCAGGNKCQCSGGSCTGCTPSGGSCESFFQF